MARTAEQRLVLRRVARVVHQHHDRLAGDVHVLVVVPAVLRRDDAVADEHQVAVLDATSGARAARRRDEVARTPAAHRAAVDDSDAVTCGVMPTSGTFWTYVPSGLPGARPIRRNSDSR
jgi:hypothetical protein